MSRRSMYRLLMGYLERLPGAMQEKELRSGEKVQECVYSHIPCGRPPLRSCSIPAWASSPYRRCSTTSTFTTTEIYDKRRRSVRDSASHKVPI